MKYDFLFSHLAPGPLVSQVVEELNLLAEERL